VSTVHGVVGHPFAEQSDVNNVLDAEAGVFSIVGFNVALIEEIDQLSRHSVIGHPGITYGTFGDTDPDKIMIADAGSISITGFEVLFPLGGETNEPANAWYNATWWRDPTYGSTWYGSATAAHVLPADAGVVTITGYGANFPFNTDIELNVDAGSVSIAGLDATFPVSVVMAAAGGSIAATGYGATFNVGGLTTIQADGGVFSINGQAVSLPYDSVLSVDAGSIVLTGYSAITSFPDYEGGVGTWPTIEDRVTNACINRLGQTAIYDGSVFIDGIIEIEYAEVFQGDQVGVSSTRPVFFYNIASFTPEVGKSLVADSVGYVVRDIETDKDMGKLILEYV